METIDFNEVIRDPETISVVGGLLEVSMYLKMNTGLLDEDFNNYKNPITISFHQSMKPSVNGPSFNTGILDVRGNLEYGWVIQTAYSLPFRGEKATRSYSESAGWTEWKSTI